ncbi:hypothetical protein MBLNU457_5256t1 [Dothideomycetes sp. NU457]
MEPWQSWAIALTGGGLAYWYYTSRNQTTPSTTRGRAQSIAESASTQNKSSKKDTKKRRTTLESSKPEPSSSDAAASTSVSDVKAENKEAQNKRRKGGKKDKPAAAPAAPTPVVAVERDEPEETPDNKSWAEQMANVRKGTNLQPPSSNDSRVRTKKTSASKASPAISASSSTGGADADDEITPAMSPSLAAGDVSDMLEKPDSGPSVLRLNNTSDPKAARNAKSQKEFQPAETKKQRQNRKKVEERRIEREAEERERQQKLENQRRTARESRGEPAKNGIPAAKAPAVNAWAADAVNRTASAPVTVAPANNGPLLDTFEPEANGGLSTGAAATSVVSNFDHEAPSEQEQTEMASEDQSGWATVGTKKQKKKGTNGESTMPAAVEPTSAPAPVAAPPVKVAPAPAPKSTNGFASLDNGFKYDAGSHPDDSQWGA